MFLQEPRSGLSFPKFHWVPLLSFFLLQLFKAQAALTLLCHPLDKWEKVAVINIGGAITFLPTKDFSVCGITSFLRLSHC